jgi:hypothetical protein
MVSFKAKEIQSMKRFISSSLMASFEIKKQIIEAFDEGFLGAKKQGR